MSALNLKKISLLIAGVSLGVAVPAAILTQPALMGIAAGAALIAAILSVRSHQADQKPQKGALAR